MAASAGAGKMLLPVAGACMLQFNPVLFSVTCLDPSGILAVDVCFKEVGILKMAMLDPRKKTIIWGISGTSRKRELLVPKIALYR